ncbi:MAG TPA: PEGA domain-containing protein [Patescibacteria group bacterium]
MVVAPILVIYTAGYRYNFKKNKLQKTGILVIESLPEKADVYINNEYKKRTKAIIKNLFPDQYDVRVEKDGYYPWQKKLSVEAGQSAFATNIILFKKAEAEKIIKEDIDFSSYSPDRKKLIYSVKNQSDKLLIVDLNGLKETIIFNNPQNKTENIEFKTNWSTSGNKILLTINKPDQGISQHWLIDINNPNNKKLLASPSRQNLEKISWEFNNEKILYGLSAGTIYQIDVTNDEIKEFYSFDNIQDFQLYFDLIYFVTNDPASQKSYLKYVDLKNQETVYNIQNLPLSPNYQFLDHPGNKISLFDQNNNLFYLIKPGQDLITTQTEIFSNVNQISWSADFSKFLYFNDFELWIVYPKNDKSEKFLINRFSKKIKEAVWHPGFEYILFVLDNSIQVIELDGRNGRNMNTLAELENITDLTIDFKSEKIYFKALEDDLNRAYFLEIN